MASNHEIAITGMGLVTSLGPTPEQTWSALLEAKRGIGPMADLEQQPERDKGGSQAIDLPGNSQGQGPVDRPRASRYLRHVIDHALRESRGLERIAPDRIGVVLGTTLHGMRTGGEFLRTGCASRLKSFLAGSILDSAVEDAAVAGPRLTTCSACSSGLSSIALGVTLLRTGQIDLALCGGYDAVSEYVYAGFDSLRLISEHLPTPFATDRQGMKVGEGYGVVVLERADDAVRHGVEVLAILAGIGESSDAFHLTQPHPEGFGAAKAIRRACAHAGIAPAEIGMVSAHGTATPNNDASEYAALASVFGTALPSVPVVGLKSHLGHTLGGAGAVELILSVLALRHQRIPFTANTVEIDPQFAGLNLVRQRPLDRAITTTMNLSLGFGGANTCAVLSSRRSQTSNSESNDDDEPVITGMGVILPGVVGCEAFRSALDDTIVASAIGNGPISEESYAHLLNARRTRRMSEYAKLTLASASAACQDAGVCDDVDFLAGCSAILGTRHGASPFCEMYYGQIVREGLAAANPVLFAEGVPNAAAAHLSMMLGLRGGCQTIIGTRCAGLDALMLGALRIRQGCCSRMIISAAEEYSPLVIDAYRACGLIPKDQEFQSCSAAVSFVVESGRSAKSRGAHIHATLGQCAWQSTHGLGAGGDVLRQLNQPAQLVCACGRVAAADKAFLRRWRTQSPRSVIWSIADRVPEMFSVGPLAALAGALLVARRTAPEAVLSGTNNSIAVLAREFSGASSGILVHPAPAPTSTTTAARDIEAEIR